MISQDLFLALVKAASLAPSSDNMQPWEFSLSSEGVKVYCVKERLLKIDVNHMFSWISIGAALENMVQQARAQGYEALVEYLSDSQEGAPVALVRLKEQPGLPHLARELEGRTCNRQPFDTKPLTEAQQKDLEEAAQGLTSRVHWLDKARHLESLVALDARFSAILLDHKPLFDGLFDTIRFTKREQESFRCGMDIKSLDMPPLFAFLAKRLKNLSLGRIISRLGMGPIIAGILASRLRKSGAICLISIPESTPQGFMETGRTMEQIWLKATQLGLSVHPYGVIPQYLTAAVLAPDLFRPEHAREIRQARDGFSALFPSARGHQPGILLRLGWCDHKPTRTTIRFFPEQLIRSEPLYKE